MNTEFKSYISNFLAGPEGSGGKNFKQSTQSPLKSAARAAGPATVMP
jgi:hypothetical protein